MGLSSIDKAILHSIEKMRWGDRIRCAYCCSLYIKQVEESIWNIYLCESCNKEFSVISNTLFKRTLLNPNQLHIFLNLVKDKQLHRRPGELSRVVGVHHWTMSKLIQRVKGLQLYDILNAPTIVAFQGLLSILKVDSDWMPYFLFLYTYKTTSQDPMILFNLTGLSEIDISNAIYRIKKYWNPGKEFAEKDKSHNWFYVDNWENDPKGTLLTLTLHAMCVAGNIKRNPITEMYSLDE